MTPEEIAKRYVYDLMRLEDESIGCITEPECHPLFCCQWNARPLCGECAGLEAGVIRIIAGAIREALAERVQ